MKKVYLLMQGEYGSTSVANAFEIKEIAGLAARGIENAWVVEREIGLSDEIIKRLSNKRSIYNVYLYTDEFTGEITTTCKKNDFFIRDKVRLNSHYETDLSIAIWATGDKVAERYAMMYFNNVSPDEDERLRFRGKKIL